MSRKSKKSLKSKSTQSWDSVYQSRLVSLFRKRLLQDGKATLPRKIVSGACEYIEETTNQDPPDVSYLRVVS